MQLKYNRVSANKIKNKDMLYFVLKNSTRFIDKAKFLKFYCFEYQEKLSNLIPKKMQNH